MEITAILTVIYLHKRLNKETTTHHTVKSYKECVVQANKIRRNVQVGKVKLFCNNKRI